MTEPAEDERTWSWQQLAPSAGMSIAIVVGSLGAGYAAADALLQGETTGWMSIFAVVSLSISAIAVGYGTVGLLLALRRNLDGDVEN